jgi:hypothetical protein
MSKQVVTMQHGLGQRGPLEPNTGELACGPETLTDEDLAHNRTDMVADALAHPVRRRVLSSALAGLVESQRADAVGGQLGRPRSTSAR